MQSTIMAASGDSSKSAKGSGSGKGKQLTQEQIVAGFQEMRNQQRATANKMSEIEMDRKEHE
jgi:prefoldin subunit 2